MGDPAGIGPEVTLKALAHWLPTLERTGDRAPITLVGDGDWWQQTYDHLHSQGHTVANPADFDLIHQPLGEPVQPGQPSATTGAASFAALDTAITQALQGQAGAIVTAPIAKSAWKAAGHDYPGQTELLAQRAGVQDYGMLFVARSPHTGWQLNTLLATTHIPLAQVPTHLTPAVMTQKLDLLLGYLIQDLGIASPQVAIAGLNPHSGEGGQLGSEEQDWLIPWLRAMGDRHPQARLVGPVPPDTLWVATGQAWWGDGSEAGAGVFDGYLALYHDQGLIPVKLLAFDRAVNTTVGLPFIRTSPDHGTAFAIAGQGQARPDSMVAALSLAWELLARQSLRNAAKLKG